MKHLPHLPRGLAAAALLAAIATATAAAPSSADQRSATPCRSAVSTAIIPSWARGGFSDPKPRVTHVLGRSGGIVAILFGGALLHSPPAQDRNNKILWVARTQLAFGEMRIRAQRMQGTTPVGKPVVRSVVGGPGPSTVDLPTAGCWRFALTWSTEGSTSPRKRFSDTLDLRYVRPAQK